MFFSIYFAFKLIVRPPGSEVCLSSWTVSFRRIFGEDFRCNFANLVMFADFVNASPIVKLAICKYVFSVSNPKGEVEFLGGKFLLRDLTKIR